MASHYFSQLPNITIRNPLDDSPAVENYITTKNLFVRGKLRDDLKDSITYFQKYTIVEGERPQDVAQKFYGSLKYDWVVLLTAGITNARSEWPLTSKTLYDYALDKYGLQDLNAVKYYETTEVKDSMGRLILPAGLVVDSTFTIADPDNGNLTLNPVIGVTNYLDETRANEEKRNIRLLRRSYLSTFVSDMKTSLRYNKSSDYINRDTKMTYNSETKGL
jgi:hypothetical protein